MEHLNVLTQDSVEVDNDKSYVRYVENERFEILCINIKFSLCAEVCLFRFSRVTFTPTMKHCDMTTIIGLCVRVKLMRSLPARYKVEPPSLIFLYF